VGLLASGTLSRKTGGSNASAPAEPHDQIRHSPLTQITKANLNDLGRPWPLTTSGPRTRSLTLAGWWKLRRPAQGDDRLQRSEPGRTQGNVIAVRSSGPIAPQLWRWVAPERTRHAPERRSSAVLSRPRNYLERVGAGAAVCLGAGCRGDTSPFAFGRSGFSRVCEDCAALLLWLRDSVMHPDRGSEHARRRENGSSVAF
jgi:hypothetical protein